MRDRHRQPGVCHRARLRPARARKPAHEDPEAPPARTCEVTDWAGLWLRIDGPSGTLTIDNMQDRPLRGTTDWTPAGIVLDVAREATKLHFGALLNGAGAMDLTRLRFEQVGEDIPVTVVPLLDEPQLDFGLAR